MLDEVPSRQGKLARMNSILWRHSLANDTVVTEIPISEAEYQEPIEPFLLRACAEGVPVT